MQMIAGIPLSVALYYQQNLSTSRKKLHLYKIMLNKCTNKAVRQKT